MIELPKENRKNEIDENPKLLVLFGKPKMGKTEIIARLDNNLIIDLEEGTNYTPTGMIVQANNLDELFEIATKIKEEGCPYEKITLDTVTSLEDMILPLAAKLYRKTPIGKNWDGTDVRLLPNGAGYLFIREAFKQVIDGFKGLCKYLILIGHTKDKMINKQGKELSENSIDLTGKLERIVAAKADALGYFYRNKNQNIINFNGGEDFITEARPRHLRGREIVIGESNEKGEIVTYWDKIFIKN